MSFEVEAGAGRGDRRPAVVFRRPAVAAVIVALVGAGCGPSSSGSSPPLASVAVAPAAAPTSLATGEEDAVPTVFVHGITGSPRDWSRLLDRLEKGRDVHREAWADEIAALPPASVSRDSLWAVGYYKRRASDPLYHGGRGSIGGCPAPRTDRAAGYFSVAYVDVVDDAVEAILRATGAERVDLVGASMGGVVSRAYVKWRSGRGPGGRSRVRRLLVLESPTRGLNDLEAVGVALDALPFQRWGEVAELARDYPAWGGRSYIANLNDGFDAWCGAHDVTYGGCYGVGHEAVDIANVPRAIQILQNLIAGRIGGGFVGGNAGASSGPSASGSSASGSSASAPGSSSSSASTAANAPPSLPITPNSPLAAIAQALIFIDPARLDLARDLAEIFSDGDGAVRSSSASLARGPEFPHAVFDQPFVGLHMDRGWHDETIQWSTDSAELVRRFVWEGRAPRATATADVRPIGAGGREPWVLVDVDVAGSDAVSAELLTDDFARWTVHQAIPAIPLDTNVRGFALAPGRNRFMVQGETRGRRVARLVVYDAAGIALDRGPIFLDLPPGAAGDVAPTTSLSATATGPGAVTLAATSNGAGAEVAFRVARVASPAPRWTSWSAAGALQLSNLGPGTYHVQARARHAGNAAGELVEDPVGDACTVVVRGDGSVVVRP
jgi:pimeloyl-ACP methyl ester carboxylesterase